ncbi:complement factor H isoform X1 [Amia ocellicauda]|uniref:complement factor H isoform X1 n=1 Tax=Amia ocellicauda TaxID=2972642 RepID=UPI003464429C
MEIVKFGFILTLWIAIFSAVKTDSDCERKFLPEKENAFIVDDDSKATYSSGETVKYTCQTGYISRGTISFRCERGTWRETAPKSCRPKPCGHPGDLENGYLQLESGQEFVFGSTVKYFCNEGYQMASRITFRNCREKGWDNDIPHCEPVMCIPEEVTAGLRSSRGNEPVPYGSVIRFECITPEHKLEGAEEIFCDAAGHWSASNPKCVEIACGAPEISNGNIQDRKEIYKNHETLRFNCDNGFKPAERGMPKCTKQGWSPEPRCEEVTCKKPSTEDFGYSSKNIYIVGERATLSCPLGLRTVTNEQSTTLTCTENWTMNEGWSISPYCEQIHCDLPVGEGLSVYRRWSYPINRYRHGDTITYNCLNGYEPRGQRQSTCRLSGWEPKPICSEITCDPPDIANGKILYPKNIYKLNERLRYKCGSGFHAVSTEVLCGEDGWDTLPSCRAQDSCVTVPTIPNASAELQSSNIFSHEETVKYNCDSLYEFEGTDVAKCINGEWVQLPKCILKGGTCGVPPHVEHAVITSPFQTHYPWNAVVSYSCEGSYKMVGSEHICCSDRGWSDSPKCQKMSCDPPRNITNASFSEKNVDREFSHGETVEYVCRDYFRFSNESSSALCVKGTWQYPTCVQQDYCDPPPKPAGGYVSPAEERYHNHDEVTYHCNDTYELHGNSTVVCSHGEWTAVPECVKPCIIPSPIDAKYNLQSPRDQVHVKHGKTYSFKCKPNHYIKNGNYLNTAELECLNEEIAYPTCVQG